MFKRLFESKDASYNTLLNLIHQYDGDRRLPIVQAIIMKEPDEEVDKGIDFYSTFAGIIFFTEKNRIRMEYSQMDCPQFRSEETTNDFGIIPNEPKTTRERVRRVLDEATYPDYPYIKTSPEVTRAIYSKEEEYANI